MRKTSDYLKQKLSKMESKQNNEDNFSAFLTYFNLLLLALIMINIMINAWTEDSPDQDPLTRNIFLPVQSTYVFIWGGINNLTLIANSVVP